MANGKILNALSFPMPLGDINVGDLATDTFAWTEAIVHPEGGSVYPFAAFKWGLCGLGGAETTYHVEPDGVHTVVDPLTGDKWWIMFRPKGNKDFCQFARISQFYSGKFDIDKATCEMWDIEAVLLTPGTRL